jgi:hypothetical protein
VSSRAGIQVFPRSLARNRARSASPFANYERLKIWDGVLGLLHDGGELGFELDDMCTEGVIFLSKRIVFLLKALAHGLEGDIALDFALFEELDTGLQLGELRLLAFTECTLCSSVWLTILHQSQG